VKGSAGDTETQTSLLDCQRNQCFGKKGLAKVKCTDAAVLRVQGIRGRKPPLVNEISTRAPLVSEISTDEHQLVFEWMHSCKVIWS